MAVACSVVPMIIALKKIRWDLKYYLLVDTR